MPSKSIYCDKYTYHYTYLITNIENGMKYIGVRSCSCLPQDDIGKIYTSSSHDIKFKQEQKQYPERFNYEVVMIWSSRREAMLHEQFLLLTPDAARSSIYYNRRNGNVKFDTYGKVTVKDNNGKTSQVSVDDPLYLSGELIPVSKGTVTVKNKEGKFYQVSVDDPRYLSGELVHNAKGTVTVKDKDGNKMQVSVDDPRYLSGELVGIAKNKTAVKDKDGNTMLVSIDDERFLSGELVSIWKGKTHTKEAKYKIGKKSSIRNKGKGNPMYGKPRSEETKQKIRETLIRKNKEKLKYKNSAAMGIDPPFSD
jgi:uncharacterized cupin superfamily protein